MVRFAIIIPIYNAEKYLQECLNSLCKQTYRNFIAILVNDGSTDTSKSIAMHYALSDSRFILVDKPNGGSSSARNTALDLLENKYICHEIETNIFIVTNFNPYNIQNIVSLTSLNFSPSHVLFLDSDDFLGDHCLQFYFDCWSKTHAEIICTEAFICDENTGNFIQKKAPFSIFPYMTPLMGFDMVEYYKFDTFFAGTSICIDFSFLRRTGLRYINSIIYEDHHFGTLLFLQAEKIITCHEAFYYIRLSQDSVTRPILKNQERYLLEYTSWFITIEYLLTFSENNPFYKTIIISQIKNFYLIAMLCSFFKLNFKTKIKKYKEIKKFLFLFNFKIYIRIPYYILKNLITSAS